MIWLLLNNFLELKFSDIFGVLFSLIYKQIIFIKFPFYQTLENIC